MATNEQTAVETESKLLAEKVPVLDEANRFAEVQLQDVPTSVKRDAFFRLHRKAIHYFNLHEQSVADSDLLGAHRNEGWVQTKAETSKGALGSILEMHRTWQAVAPVIEIDPAAIRPTDSAFAALQRIVSDFFPEDVAALRGRFVELGLPTAGFPKMNDAEKLLSDWTPVLDQLELKLNSSPMAFLPLNDLQDQITSLVSDGARIVAANAPWLTHNWQACDQRRRGVASAGVLGSEVPLATFTDEIRERLALLRQVAGEMYRNAATAKRKGPASVLPRTESTADESAAPPSRSWIGYVAAFVIVTAYSYLWLATPSLKLLPPLVGAVVVGVFYYYRAANYYRRMATLALCAAVGTMIVPTIALSIKSPLGDARLQVVGASGGVLLVFVAAAIYFVSVDARIRHPVAAEESLKPSRRVNVTLTGIGAVMLIGLLAVVWHLSQRGSSATPFGVVVRVHGPNGPSDLVCVGGDVVLDVGQQRRPEQVDAKGQATFQALAADLAGEEVHVAVSCPHHEVASGHDKILLVRDGATYLPLVAKKLKRGDGLEFLAIRITKHRQHVLLDEDSGKSASTISLDLDVVLQNNSANKVAITELGCELVEQLSVRTCKVTAALIPTSGTYSCDGEQKNVALEIAGGGGTDRVTMEFQRRGAPFTWSIYRMRIIGTYGKGEKLNSDHFVLSPRGPLEDACDCPEATNESQAFCRAQLADATARAAAWSSDQWLRLPAPTP